MASRTSSSVNRAPVTQRTPSAQNNAPTAQRTPPTQNSASRESSRSTVAGGCIPSEASKTPLDESVISEECQEKKCPDKNEKCCDLKELIDLLKDMFGDEDDEKDSSSCGGGGQAGGGGQCGGGGRTGGCNKTDGPSTVDDQKECDPIAALEKAVEAVENARCSSRKAGAVEKLKVLYEKAQDDELDIPEELENRIKKALGTNSSPSPDTQEGETQEPATVADGSTPAPEDRVAA